MARVGAWLRVAMFAVAWLGVFACGELSHSLDAKNQCNDQSDCLSGYGCQDGVCLRWVDAPATVSTQSFTGAQKFLVNIPTVGNYYVIVRYDATSASVQMHVEFGHDTVSQSSEAGSGKQFSAGSFDNVTAGPYVVQVDVGSGVTVTQVSVTVAP